MTAGNHKIIFTGGPGFGKSSVIEQFRLKGFHCIPDAPRQVLEEQSKLKSGILPQGNFERFAMLVLERMVRQYLSAGPGICLFDRGIPDIMAYLDYAGLKVPEAVTGQVNKHSFHSTIFFFPPWEEIYKKDRVRYETFEQARSIGDCIKHTYKNLGYSILEVPKNNIRERVKYVERHLPLI